MAIRGKNSCPTHSFPLPLTLTTKKKKKDDLKKLKKNEDYFKLRCLLQVGKNLHLIYEL